jgi:diacylglycerol O-acyltransferase
MVDGVGGVDLISVVLDHERHPQPAGPDVWEPQPEVSSFRLVTDAVWELAMRPTEQLRALTRAVRAPRRALERLADVTVGLRAYGGALQFTPRTSLDGTIGPHRRWVVARASLDDIRTIKQAYGGTVNDVVLSAIAGGFRDLIEARGEAPEDVALRSLVPVSVRTDDARGVLDNRVSAIFFELPVGIADPIARLDAVRQRMSELKASHEAEAGEALTSLLGLVPSPLTASATRLAIRVFERVPQRTMNTVTTNVPGPAEPLYATGREMLEYLPYVPLGTGVRIGVAILSYNGRLAFGITGDYDEAPDIDILAAGIERAIAGLVGVAPTARAS